MIVRSKLSLSCIAVLAVVVNSVVMLNAHAEPAKTHADFLRSLSELCGERFQGVMTFPDDETHDFANRVLVASVETCSDSEIRVPFQVGEDQSRTWVFKKVPGGIELKHDHRHKDGSVDEISDYGGTTLTAGTASSQSFPADEFTQNLIPAAATNVWTVSLDADKTELTYYLERQSMPRFKAVLKRLER